MTIQPLELYGDLDRPEDMNKIDVNASPVDIVKSTYSMWLHSLLKTNFERTLPLNPDNPYTDSIYKEAVLLLKPHAKAFENLKQNELETIMFYVNDKGTDDSGVYLSAMLNATDLKELNGVFNYKILGYRHVAGKKIIAQNNSNIDNLGMHAEGDIVNYGMAANFANHSKDGIQINFNNSTYFANYASGGKHINYGKRINRFGTFVTGGTQINFSDDRISQFSSLAMGGIQLNFGNLLEDNFAFGADGGLQVNLGDINLERMATHPTGGLQINYADLPGDFLKPNNEKTQINFKKRNLLENILSRFHSDENNLKYSYFAELEHKIREIEFMKNIEGDDSVNNILNFDWKDFEEEVLTLQTKIEGVLK